MRPGARPERLKLVEGLGLALLALVAIAYWWPGGLCYRSDDWLALHWSRDFANVLHDFAGPYQGADRIALFHRPWITASVFFDTQIAQILGDESAPFFPLLMNVLVHCASAFVLYAILRPLGTWSALAATAWWLVLPGHTEAISWMIGRVDTHATFLCLLALLFERRSFEGENAEEPARSWAALALFFVACWTKEVAFVLPGLVFAHALLRSPGKLRTRIGAASSRSWPWLAVLLAVLLYRLLVLGEAVGGYAEGVLQPARAFESFAVLLASGGFGTVALFVFVAALVLRLLRASASTSRRARLAWTAGSLIAALLASLPTAGTGGGTDARDERYQYFPSACLAGAVAVSGPIAPLVLFAARAPEMLAQRSALREACAEIRTQRDAIRDALRAEDRPDKTPYFHPLPAAIDGFRAFHVGVDRLGRPPFSPRERSVLPDRPLFPGIAAQRGAPSAGSATWRAALPTLDRARLDALASGSDSVLSFASPAAASVKRARVAFYTCFGHLLTDVEASANGDQAQVSLRGVLASAPSGCPPTSNTLHSLWPGVEIGLGEIYVRVELQDASGARLDATGDLQRFEITRELGEALRPKKPGYLYLLCVLVALVALLFVSRRARP